MGLGRLGRFRGAGSLLYHPSDALRSPRAKKATNLYYEVAVRIQWRDPMGEMIQFKRPDGKTCPSYLATPKAGSSAPGFVVIQEWWGLNDQIKMTADRLAEAGYRALVPDFYRGKVTTAADEANHLMTNLNFPYAAGQDIRGAVQYLKTSSKKVAVGGFCMGGALTILAAVRVPEMDAGACFYGIPPLDAAALKQISS